MSIRLKLVIIFLAVALIPLLLVSAVTFHNYKNSLETNRLSQLKDIAAYKADKIETYFADLKIYFELSQVAYVIKKNLPVLTQLASDSANPEFIEAKRMIDAVYEKMPSSLGLLDVMLINPQGRIVYSSNPEHFQKEFLKFLPGPQQKAFNEGKDKIHFSDIFFNEARNDKPGMLITGPVRDFNGHFIGVIATEVDLAPIYKIIQNTTGLGETGETLVGELTGNQALFLNPLRHDAQAALKRRVSIGGMLGGPIQAAVQGKTGSGQNIDYRGKMVIAAWRYLPSLGWGMVAKIDTEEAFADVANLRKLLMMILAIVIVLAGIMAVSVAQSIAGPINKLSTAVRMVSSGNLDYKVATNSKDEIGQLSRAFDKMILEQKRAQESLHAASQYARNLIETSLDPLVTISTDGKITDVNEATTKVTGVSREKLIGTDFSDYFTEPQKAREGYQQVFDKGFVVDYPLVVRHKDGHLMDVLYNASVFKDAQGNVLGVFAAARDVTAQKQIETELKHHRDNLEVLVKERTNDLAATNRKLAKSNENLEQFAYVASHDLQEPLRIMASYSQLLEKRYKDKLDQDANDFIGFIVDAAGRMQKLIVDLLAYSRVGRGDATVSQINSNDLLGKVIKSMSATIESSNAKVIYEDLPALSVHETGFIQLFQNLIGNALKFKSKEPPVIRITARQDNSEWVFSVSDNGIGIEPQYREKIFQIFQRLHSKDDYPGTGIGLSICKKLVENYGGRIWVESQLGKGSTFYFTLPQERTSNG